MKLQGLFFQKECNRFGCLLVYHYMDRFRHRWGMASTQTKRPREPQTYCKTFPTKDQPAAKLFTIFTPAGYKEEIWGFRNETKLILHDFWGTKILKFKCFFFSFFFFPWQPLGANKVWARREESSKIHSILAWCEKLDRHHTFRLFDCLRSVRGVGFRQRGLPESRRFHTVGSLPTEVITFQALISRSHLPLLYVKLPRTALMSDIQCGLLRDLLRVPLNHKCLFALLPCVSESTMCVCVWGGSIYLCFYILMLPFPWNDQTFSTGRLVRLQRKAEAVLYFHVVDSVLPCKHLGAIAGNA